MCFVFYQRIDSSSVSVKSSPLASTRSPSSSSPSSEPASASVIQLLSPAEVSSSISDEESLLSFIIFLFFFFVVPFSRVDFLFEPEESFVLLLPLFDGASLTLASLISCWRIRKSRLVDTTTFPSSQELSFSSPKDSILLHAFIRALSLFSFSNTT